MVEFVDGSTIAQASPPDMRLPISLALGWPDRVPGAAGAVDWRSAHVWEFLPVDESAFPAVALAKAAGRAGRCRPAIYNAANEECVAGFTEGRLAFPGIVDTVARVLDEAPDFDEPGTVEDVLAAETWARGRARELIAGSRTDGSTVATDDKGA
jgi:1-deoxy-D-xylulose-5-phosphate reductoisomerase